LLSGFEYVAELSDSELKANDISSVLLVSYKMHDLDSGIIWMVFPQGGEKLKNWKKGGYKLSCLEFDLSVHVAGVVFLNSLWSCYSAAFGTSSFSNWNDGHEPMKINPNTPNFNGIILEKNLHEVLLMSS